MLPTSMASLLCTTAVPPAASVAWNCCCRMEHTCTRHTRTYPPLCMRPAREVNVLWILFDWMLCFQNETDLWAPLIVCVCVQAAACVLNPCWLTEQIRTAKCPTWALRSMWAVCTDKPPAQRFCCTEVRLLRCAFLPFQRVAHLCDPPFFSGRRCPWV